MTTTSLRALALAATKNIPWVITEDCCDGKEEMWCYWHSVGPFILTGDAPDADSLYLAALSPATVLLLLDVVDAARKTLCHTSLGEELNRAKTLRDALAALDAEAGEK